MLSSFSPPTHTLTEATSIALLAAIQCQPILTSLSPDPIPTTYVQQGKGAPPLLLLHGFDSSVLEFRRLLPLLAQQTETWAVDLLGFGFTSRAPNLAFSPMAIKTHLYATWQQLIGQPVVLVGASMGGAAAIDFTLTYPEAVQQLVLLDSAGYRGAVPVGKWLISPFDRWATAFLQRPSVRQSISLKAYFDPSFASTDAQDCTSLHLTQPGWQQALMAFTRSGGYGSFRSRLNQIHCPTLILWGRQDRILGTADADRFHQAIPHSHLIWVETCGHVPHLEHSQLTAQHIWDFVTSERL